MAVRHARARIEHILEVFAKVTVSGAAATLSVATGELAETADFTFTNNAAGDYTVTINPLKMPRGEAYAQVTAVSAASKIVCTIKSIAYTNDSLAINVLFLVANTGTLTDPDSFFLHVVAQ